MQALRNIFPSAFLLFAGYFLACHIIYQLWITDLKTDKKEEGHTRWQDFEVGASFDLYPKVLIQAGGNPPAEKIVAHADEQFVGTGFEG